MAKILVALEADSTFSRDLVNVAGKMFVDLEDQLFVALLVKDVAYTSKISTNVNTMYFIFCLKDYSL